ncbi:MAG: Gfo/Idh/MocA family oxidoreductase [Candidatus Brocadiia bacterium]
MKREKPKVAVIGASGIGKHHAKWWDIEGADVCAFAGSSPDSVTRTGEMLADMFGFDGEGYAEVDALLREQRPDIVDVCTPPEWHFRHAAAALDAGCDVLCEKPFVCEPGADPAVLLQKARKLVKKAEDAGRRLGLCSQYHAVVRCCRDILTEHTGQEQVTRYRGHIESPARDRPPDPLAVWIDLSPHMLAAAQALAPGAGLARDTVRTFFSGYQASARFRVERRDGEAMDCHVVTGRTLPGAEAGNIRDFELNDARFRIGGGTDADGVYCAAIQTPWGTFERPDGLRLIIREFLEGGVPLDGPSAVTNLSWMLELAPN